MPARDFIRLILTTKTAQRLDEASSTTREKRSNDICEKFRDRASQALIDLQPISLNNASASAGFDGNFDAISHDPQTMLRLAVQ